jgi:hypothetical protein
LFVDVAFGPNRTDVLEVAGPGAEGEPVENVQNPVLFRIFANHDRSLVYVVRIRNRVDSQYFDVSWPVSVYVAQASACDSFLDLHRAENHRLKPVPPKSGT